MTNIDKFKARYEPESLSEKTGKSYQWQIPGYINFYKKDPESTSVEVLRAQQWLIS